MTRTCNEHSCNNIADHFYNMRTCSHVTCAANHCTNWGVDADGNKKCLSAAVTTSDGSPASSRAAYKNHLVVSHNNAEQNGEAHICRWEYGQTNDCVCKCFNRAEFSDSEIARAGHVSTVRIKKIDQQTGASYPDASWS